MGGNIWRLIKAYMALVRTRWKVGNKVSATEIPNTDNPIISTNNDLENKNAPKVRSSNKKGYASLRVAILW